MPESTIIEASAIIPTRNRAPVLFRTLESLAKQSTLPKEIIIVDASTDDATEKVVRDMQLQFPKSISFIYEKAKIKGAATQRIQAVDLSTCEFIFFMDDDILLEEECVSRLFKAFSIEDRVGGVGAMITNQLYTKPGTATRIMYTILSGQRRKSWAGMIVGPGWNLLPEDDLSLPEYVKCEWLNLGCTIYRKIALPDPLFPSGFTGYSLLEDVSLSATVAKNWTLLNARTARIFHDSQPGDHKKDHAQLSEMDLVNRHFVMRNVLGRKGVKNYFKLFLFSMFGTVSGAMSSKSFNVVFADLKGKIRALKHILRERTGGHRK